MPGDGTPNSEETSTSDFSLDNSDKTQEALNSLSAEYARLQEQFQSVSKSKESIVMRYANSEKEVIKLRKELENSDKQIKNLMKETEALNQKNKQLTTDKSRLSQLVDSKNNIIEEENKRLRIRVEELQNELKGSEITKSQFSRDFAQERLSLQENADQAMKKIAELQEELASNKKDLDEIKQKNVQLDEAQVLQKDCDKLKEELSSKEFIIKWTQDRVLSLECECEQARHNNVELLNDMSVCRSKEIELLAYTQQVTEKNVSLQSKLSAMEAKVSALEEENKKLALKIKISSGEMKGFEKVLSIEKSGFNQEKQNLLDKLQNLEDQISTLQKQLDEARGELSVSKKKHDLSLKEMSKELRRQVKDGSSALEGISLSSRTSSCSSLNTVDTSIGRLKNSESTPVEKQQDLEPPVMPMPDQQALIERILKLQRMLVKKQEKIDFLQDHGSQLVDELQKKSKLIQVYAMTADSGTLSSERSDQNKVEAIKHGGVMASLYASKPSEEGPSLELSLEINSKLQAVLEDSLLKNITLKENVNTLGAEIYKLSQQNKKLSETLEKLNVV